mmetsp:Transcript_8650/g.20772  ORF Transcript_8650/g.20772 Transcript_8650/m.20772 type:complete len:203 (-) Transcript_8650:244-852(-)|eukprot:CAMPEP_0113628112 /NCGR_PEP_ID=MMETSP0017_2-20120614/14567_1 /TAXON_ID=2856 /ORGANISM="Cylindrotheca closterium" /LENGTH=202 /DNA_ID=CAMNT_0000538407 /DNA_START=298 /DNA_END=906 /DNA_ORIENTATION=- /assembly_acc=CAM_ASM_000147
MAIFRSALQRSKADGSAAAASSGSESSSKPFMAKTSDRTRLFLVTLLLGLFGDFDGWSSFSSSSSSSRFIIDSLLIMVFLLLSILFGEYGDRVGDFESGSVTLPSRSSSSSSRFLMANFFKANFFRPPGVFGDSPNNFGDKLLRDLDSVPRTLRFFLPGVIGDSKAFKPCFRWLLLLFLFDRTGDLDREEGPLTELRELLPE